MPDVSEFMKTIKRAAVDAVNAEKPVEACFGKVISALPLRILVDQKLTLGKAQLILCRSVTDYKAEVTIDWFTEETGGGSGDAAFTSHKHAMKGRKEITVHRGLAVGDEVILLRQQGGQKYIVVDRVG